MAIAAESELVGLLGKEIFFPTGLLGFPSCQRFNFNRFNPGDGSVSPFFILESADQEVSFPLIHPDFVPRDYPLQISAEVMSSLEAQNTVDLVALLIVTVA
jgi:flagellar assembly factor FliW